MRFHAIPAPARKGHLQWDIDCPIKLYWFQKLADVDVNAASVFWTIKDTGEGLINVETWALSIESSGF